MPRQSPGPKAPKAGQRGPGLTTERGFSSAQGVVALGQGRRVHLGWIPARCPGSHCPPVAILGAQGPGVGVDSELAHRAPEWPRPLSPLLMGGPSPVAPLKNGRSSDLRPEDLPRWCPTPSTSRRRGGTSPLQLPVLSARGWTSPSPHPPRAPSHLPASPGGFCCLPRPRLLHLGWPSWWVFITDSW